MSKKKNLEIYLISFAQIISMFFPKGKKKHTKKYNQAHNSSQRLI